MDNAPPPKIPKGIWYVIEVSNKKMFCTFFFLFKNLTKKCYQTGPYLDFFLEWDVETFFLSIIPQFLTLTRIRNLVVVIIQF